MGVVFLLGRGKKMEVNVTGFVQLARPKACPQLDWGATCHTYDGIVSWSPVDNPGMAVL